jgi:hypothetical protein
MSQNGMDRPCSSDNGPNRGLGDREPIVLQRQLPGMGRAMRYIITIADDDRRPLDKQCQKLSAADIACDVMRNVFGPG